MHYHTTLIDPEELAALKDADVRIFDVRHDLADPQAGEEAYRQSRIPGALFLHVDRSLSAALTAHNGRHPLPDREDFHDLIVTAGVGRDTQVVVYDQKDGAMAARLWWMLRWLGHERVAVLNGGWQAWQDAGLPVDDRVLEGTPPLPGPAANPLPLRDPINGTVDADTVLANIDKGDFVVLDARAAARYRGEIEPMDPVAGHIPGALNRPNTDNLVNGRFKSSEQLRHEFTAILREREPTEVVHQCGSGITACHNLLAMEHAGLTGSRLYPGSWSEWCSDPLRPVA